MSRVRLHVATTADLRCHCGTYYFRINSMNFSLQPISESAIVRKWAMGHLTVSQVGHSH